MMQAALEKGGADVGSPNDMAQSYKGFGGMRRNTTQDVSEFFLSDGFEISVDKIKTLAEDCGMRNLNAMRASKAFKLFINISDTNDMNKEEFSEFMINLMKKYDLCDT